MDYTKEQLNAAYALNLCTVSVSQIIQYNDIAIMEQEYEAILNNLNLEQIPKDEALLNILKQLLDTITFFRIQDGDKQLVEREYQQKMRNAIWAAVPNIGMIVNGGSPISIAISLASQVGIGYMNYRRAKAENALDKDREDWELERTAIEQFNGLQRELFDTSWRLAATYKFPDELRLTERQIRQYNDILMDGDLLRKYERLDTIKDNFFAYPPFWYYFGNTANAIAKSSNLDLSDSIRNKYKSLALSHFKQYRALNNQGFLREDQISASCALELADLLPIESQGEAIHELLEEAIRYSGRANDVLQLSAITYIKINDYANASKILKELVNESYNTIQNSQLLSSIYVSAVKNHNSSSAKDAYDVLKSRVGAQYLYPMPLSNETDHMLQYSFMSTQRKVLYRKYCLAYLKFSEQCVVKYGKILPPPSQNIQINDVSYYAETDKAISSRKEDYREILTKQKRLDQFKSELKEVNFSSRVLDLLNAIFKEISCLDLVNKKVRINLSMDIEKAIKSNRDILNNIQQKIDGDNFKCDDMCKLLDIHLSDFTKSFFEDLSNYTYEYVRSREEMQDFAFAEQNLREFCEHVGIPSPELLYGEDGELPDTSDTDVSPRFSLNLLKTATSDDKEYIDKLSEMEQTIQSAIPRIVLNDTRIDFFTRENSRIERYFNSNAILRKNISLKSETLAILCDNTNHGKYDLIFKGNAIVPVKNGFAKSPIAYKDVNFVNGNALGIGGNYFSKYVNMQQLFILIQSLSNIAFPFQKKEPFFNHKK